MSKSYPIGARVEVLPGPHCEGMAPLVRCGTVLRLELADGVLCNGALVKSDGGGLFGWSWQELTLLEPARDPRHGDWFARRRKRRALQREDRDSARADASRLAELLKGEDL